MCFMRPIGNCANANMLLFLYSPLEFMQDSDAEVQKILASEGEVKKLTMDKIQMVFQHLIKKDQKDELQKGIYTPPPPKLCLWEGILFSRCSSVRP